MQCRAATAAFGSLTDGGEVLPRTASSGRVPKLDGPVRLPPVSCNQRTHMQ